MILEQARGAFGCDTVAQRARGQMLASLVGLGRATITGLLCAQGRQFEDWTADYRLYSHARVEPARIFDAVRRGVELYVGEGQPLVVGMDDSLLRKRGSKIPGAGWKRDPLSPPFHCNFVRGLRVLQLSAALPQGDGGARLVPIDFQHAPRPDKPSRKATEVQRQQYQQDSRQANINRVGAARLAVLRQTVDPRRPITAVVDNRFTNATVLGRLPEGMTLIGRIRKDARLHFPPQEQPSRGRKRLYGPRAPTPEALRQDESIPWQTIKAFATGKTHAFRVKTLTHLLLPLGGKARAVRLLVIAPLGYRPRKNSRMLYRQPAFLISTDPNIPLSQMLQSYLWRWDIEVNFRDEKTLLGVGQAQLRHPQSLQRQPATMVAAYAMLLLAAAHAFGPKGQPDELPPPKWRHPSPDRRPSTAQLINLLRHQLWTTKLLSTHFSPFSSSYPPDHNPQKILPNPLSALSYAAA